MADADRVDAEQALHDQQEKERAMKKAMVERLKTKELELHARDSRIAELEASLMQTQDALADSEAQRTAASYTVYEAVAAATASDERVTELESATASYTV